MIFTNLTHTIYLNPPVIPLCQLIEEYYINRELARGLRSKHGAEGIGHRAWRIGFGVQRQYSFQILIKKLPHPFLVLAPRCRKRGSMFSAGYEPEFFGLMCSCIEFPSIVRRD